MRKIPLPIFEEIAIEEDTPEWIKSIEECRKKYELSYSCSSEELHQSLLDNSYNYIKFGIKIKAAIQNKLYIKKGFKTFEEYCLKVFRMSEPYCRKIMRAARMAILLIKCGFDELPRCISHAYKFAELVSDRPGKRTNEEIKIAAQKWQDVLDAAEISKTPITTNFILKVLEPNSYTPFKAKFSEKIYNALKELTNFWSWKNGREIDINQYISITVENSYLQLINSPEYKEYQESPYKYEEQEADEYYSVNGGRNVSREEIIQEFSKEHQEDESEETSTIVESETNNSVKKYKRYNSEITLAKAFSHPVKYLEKLRISKPHLSEQIDSYIKFVLEKNENERYGDKPP
ncbi:MAG: hypothetical protein SWX82_08610 [Cyanobacteriota bacterium]|nr:hypothetical protein [Cyanobacteriota bacterium]